MIMVDGESSWMDRMSILPDELLRIILSHLTFNEAIATSILSRRWRYLWTNLGSLVFDGTGFEGEKRAKYVKWVNDVIALRTKEELVLDEFRVSLYLSKAEEGVMHEWVRYALERKAHTLELNLSSEGRGRLSRKESCSFPYTILQQHSIHFKQLRRISLEAVNVSGKALEFFLSNCPLLEGLSVSQSTELVTLRVIGPLPSLKLLEIRCCMSLKYVEIRDVASLVCLKYYGPDVENTPMLVELFVGAWVRFLENFLMQFGGILGQLEMLNLEMRSPEHRWYVLKLWNLKQLVVTYITSLPSRIRCMIQFANILQYSPRLEKYVLKLKAPMSGNCRVRRIEEPKVTDMYSNLKEVEYVGYGGVACELDFVKHLVSWAPKLQKITIHLRKLHLCPRTNLIPNKAIEARALAHRQLVALVPSSIILDIF